MRAAGDAMTLRTKDESGAYSILFALMALILFGMAALAVDLGNVMSRKSDVQGQADFAALGAALKLGTRTSGEVPADVVTEARLLLNANRARNWPGNDCDTGPACIADDTELTDDNLENGEVHFVDDGLEVVTPLEWVDYGFIQAFPGRNDDDEVAVQGRATVGLFSPGLGPLPMYAASGCDHGTQTLTDPAGGPATPATASNLALPADTNSADISMITTPSPPQIPVQAPPAPGPLLGLSGSGFHQPSSGANEAWVTKIGFFLEDGATYHAAPVVTGTRTNAFVAIDNIPQDVASTEGLWWVRVFKKKVGDPDTAGAWSPMNEAVPLRVGTIFLECDAGASDGNFGTLRLPRTDVVPADQLPANIAMSLQDPLSLAIHESADSTGLCYPGADPTAVESDIPSPGLLSGTNCVGTDPGLPANVATAGFITGADTSMGHVDGRLDAGNHPTNPACGRADHSIDLGPRSYPVNNDTLSCFLTDTSSLSTITDPNYSGPSKLNQDIYESPRFFWLPVLAVEPDSGASNRYSIIDFRPGFITDEGLESTQGSSSATDANGLIVQTTQVKQVKVVFFDADALPSSVNGPVSDYLGVGPKILRLVD